VSARVRAPLRRPAASLHRDGCAAPRAGDGVWPLPVLADLSAGRTGQRVV
jgi:hypothetical protein